MQHGIGVAASTKSQAGGPVVGQIAKSAPAEARSAESSMMRATPSWSPASNAGSHRAIAIESSVMRG
jgi:hypothetical protein